MKTKEEIDAECKAELKVAQKAFEKAAAHALKEYRKAVKPYWKEHDKADAAAYAKRDRQLAELKKSGRCQKKEKRVET